MKQTNMTTAQEADHREQVLTLTVKLRNLTDEIRQQMAESDELTSDLSDDDAVRFWTHLGYDELRQALNEVERI